MKNRSKFMRLFTNLGALPDKTAEITRCMRGRTHAEKEAIASRPIKELEEGKIPQHEISPTVNIIDRK